MPHRSSASSSTAAQPLVEKRRPSGTVASSAPLLAAPSSAPPSRTSDPPPPPTSLPPVTSHRVASAPDPLSNSNRAAVRPGAPNRPHLFVDVGTELLESIASPRAAAAAAADGRATATLSTPTPPSAPRVAPPQGAPPAQVSTAPRGPRASRHNLGASSMRTAAGRSLRGGRDTTDHHPHGGGGAAASRFKLLHAQAQFQLIVAIRCAMFLVRLRRRWMVSRLHMHLRTVLFPRMAFRIQCVFRRYRQRRMACMRAAAQRIVRFLKPKAMYLVVRRVTGLHVLQRIGRGLTERQRLSARRLEAQRELLMRVLRKPLRLAAARKRLAALRSLRDERQLFIAQAAVVFQALVRDERIGCNILQKYMYDAVQTEKKERQRRRSVSRLDGSQDASSGSSGGRPFAVDAPEHSVSSASPPLEPQETMYPYLVEVHESAASASNARRESVSFCLRSLTTAYTSGSTASGGGISYAWSRDWGGNRSSSPTSPLLHAARASGGDEWRQNLTEPARALSVVPAQQQQPTASSAADGMEGNSLPAGSDDPFTRASCAVSSSSPEDSPAAALMVEGTAADGRQLLQQQEDSNCAAATALTRLESLLPPPMSASFSPQQAASPAVPRDAPSPASMRSHSGVDAAIITSSVPTPVPKTDVAISSSCVSSPRFGPMSSSAVTPHNLQEDGSSLDESPQHARHARATLTGLPDDAAFPTTTTAAAAASATDDSSTMGHKLRSSVTMHSKQRRRTTLRAPPPPDDVQVAFMALLDRTESIERKTAQNGMLQSLHAMRQHVAWCIEVLNCRDRVPRTFVSLLTQLSPSWILKLAVNLFEQEAEERLAVVDEYDATPLMFLGRPIMGSNSEKRRKRMKDLLQQRAERLFESYVHQQGSPGTSPSPQPSMERSRRGTLVRPTVLRHSIVSLESATTAAAALNEQAVQFRNEGLGTAAHSRRQTIVVPNAPPLSRGDHVLSPFAAASASSSRPSRSAVVVAVHKVSPGGTGSDDGAGVSGGIGGAISPMSQSATPSPRVGGGVVGGGFRMPIETASTSRVSVFCGSNRHDSVVSPRNDGGSALSHHPHRTTSTDSNSPRASVAGGGGGPFSRNSQFETTSERSYSLSGRLSIADGGAAATGFSFGRSIREGGASPRGQRTTFFADDMESSRKMTTRSPRTSTNFPAKRVTFSSISIEPLSPNVPPPSPGILSSAPPLTQHRPEALRSRSSGADLEMSVGSAWAAAYAHATQPK